jgi:hypothetical protein
MPASFHLRVTIAILLTAGVAIFAGAQAAPPQDASSQIHVTVSDPTGQPLSGVAIVVQQNGKVVAQAKTSTNGSATFTGLAPGSYKVMVEKQGFYAATVEKLEAVAGQTSPVDVRLQPKKEFHEEVEVRSQPSIIDPEESAGSQTLSLENIATIPYPSTRDYRNILPFVPGVIVDRGGQPHVAGSATQSVQDYMDGFEVGQPASGALALRVSPDALRRLDVRNTRYSAQYGKGSGGLLDLEAQDGDNRLRYNATDFIPTFQLVKGINFNNWTPRAYISGPVVRDKVWFDISHEGENDLSIVKELPDGADSTTLWRTADMARLRMSLSHSNVLSATGVMNIADATHAGISPFDPVSVSQNQHSILGLVTLKDQITLTPGTLLEFGTAFHWTKSSSLPLGNDPYLLTFTGRQGNYFVRTVNDSNRTQAFSNLYLKPWKHLGAHQITMGGRVDRVIYRAAITRSEVLALDGSGNILRTLIFDNAPPFNLSTMESSGFIQDRWSAKQRLVVETGARWDRDSFVHRDVFSPRVAGSLLVAKSSETKLTAGAGIYYDRTNLNTYSVSLQGGRADTFFLPTGTLFLPATFSADPRQLTLPRFLNWSAGAERRLPGKVYTRVEYIRRHGSNGWAYELQPDGNYLLQTKRQDHYDAAQITVRKEFKRGYPFLVSYTRSKVRSNETVDFTVDNTTSGNQVGGVLPWDSPNQIVAWGSTPLPWKLKKFDFAYSVLWRTGFPFVTTDEFARLVSGPGQFRFPSFFSLNPAIERKFGFKGNLWAARIGIDNITDSQNPTFVDNNVNSPTFLVFGGFSRRTLNGRIRWLGKKPN